MEAPYVRNKFYVLQPSAQDAAKLRCVYCESDVDRFVVAHKKHKWYADDAAPLLSGSGDHFKELVVFADADEATGCGYHGKKSSGAPKSQRASAKSG